MSDDVDLEYIYGSSGLLPFYGCVVATAQYLKTLPFLQEFHGAIYTYARADNPNIALPALFISMSNINSSGSGFQNYGTMDIEIVRNIASSNRGNIFKFRQQMTERMVQSTVFDNRYKRAIETQCPYISTIAMKYNANIIHTQSSSRVSMDFMYMTTSYLNFAREHAFDATGLSPVNTVIRDISVVGDINLGH